MQLIAIMTTALGIFTHTPPLSLNPHIYFPTRCQDYVLHLPYPSSQISIALAVSIVSVVT